MEEIEDPLIQKVRCLDKLFDELVMGKKMELILLGSKEIGKFSDVARSL